MCKSAQTVINFRRSLLAENHGHSSSDCASWRKFVMEPHMRLRENENVVHSPCVDPLSSMLFFFKEIRCPPRDTCLWNQVTFNCVTIGPGLKETGRAAFDNLFVRKSAELLCVKKDGTGCQACLHNYFQRKNVFRLIVTQESPSIETHVKSKTVNILSKICSNLIFHFDRKWYHRHCSCLLVLIESVLRRFLQFEAN